MSFIFHNFPQGVGKIVKKMENLTMWASGCQNRVDGK